MVILVLATLGFGFSYFFLSIEIESQVIFGVVVAVICFVMHNKIAIDKIKRIRFRFKRVSNHLLDCLTLQFGKVIDVFHSIFAVGYTKSKIKIERFEHFVAEKVSFNHTEILDGLGTNAEINGSANFLKPRIENKSLRVMKVPTQYIAIYNSRGLFLGRNTLKKSKV